MVRNTYEFEAALTYDLCATSSDPPRDLCGTSALLAIDGLRIRMILVW